MATSTMRIRNDSGDLDKLTRWIIETCDAARLSKKTAFAVQLCLDEAVANILEHGKGSARASAIAADLERSDSEVVLDIEDDGGPFDPTRWRRRRCRIRWKSASVGGRGIHLIRQFSSRMEYARSRRPQPAAADLRRLTFAAWSRGHTRRRRTAPRNPSTGAFDWIVPVNYRLAAGLSRRSCWGV